MNTPIVSYGLVCDLLDRGWSLEFLNINDRSGPGSGPGVPMVVLYLRKHDGTVLHCRESTLGAAIAHGERLAREHEMKGEHNAGR